MAFPRSIANTTGSGGWADALAKAQAFLDELTLEEKAQMVTGVPGPCVGNILAIERLNFPGLCLQDGPLAIRVASYASVFSAGVSVAASWDKDIMYERGAAMATEFKGKGAHIYLGYVRYDHHSIQVTKIANTAHCYSDLLLVR